MFVSRWGAQLCLLPLRPDAFDPGVRSRVYFHGDHDAIHINGSQQLSNRPRIICQLRIHIHNTQTMVTHHFTPTIPQYQEPEYLSPCRNSPR
jgi:hypothetical protein